MPLGVSLASQGAATHQTAQGETRHVCELSRLSRGRGEGGGGRREGLISLKLTYMYVNQGKKPCDLIAL